MTRTPSPPTSRSPPARAPRWCTRSPRTARRERLRGRVLRRLRSVEGVDLLAWMEGDEACLWSDRGELRFAPGTHV